ncbi:reverse transcriptase domain-containing protein [Thermopirellula anaerolimosa]
MSTVGKDLVTIQAHLCSEQKKLGGPVPHLTAWLVDRRNLKAAWQRVKAAPGAESPGPDGLTPRHVKNPDRFLSAIAEEILKGRFRPSPFRTVEVPKGPHKVGTRTLTILNLRDRVVHTAVKQILEPLFEPTFSSASYGFRPGRSVAGAVAGVVRALSEPGNALSYGCGLDIADCFDHLDVSLLLSQLSRGVQDSDFLGLLELILESGSRRVGLWHPRRVGILQGSPLSPLLCNLYLDPIDRAMAAYHASRSHQADYFRYADDILLLAESPSELLGSVRRLHHSLQEKGLRLREFTTPLAILAQSTSWILNSHADVVSRLLFSYSPVKHGVSWLGVHIRPRCVLPRERVLFGYYVPDSKIADILAAVEEMTALPDIRLEPKSFVASGWIRSLNRQLRQWRQAYMHADNAYAVFQVVDDFVQRQVKRLLKHLYKISAREVHERFSRRLPRGFRTFEVEGVQLVTLSAMPPERPGRLIYKPAWLNAPARAANNDAARALVQD